MTESWDSEAQGAALDESPVSPPVGWLVAAGITVVFALLLTVLVDDRWGRLLGYVLGTLVTISLIAVFRSKDQRARMSALYSPREHLRAIQILIMTAGILIGGYEAFRFALAVARS